MSLFQNEIPTRLGYKNLYDHADIYGKSCYIETESKISHRTYKYKESGTWCMSVYYIKETGNIQSLEINSTYYEKTEMFKKAEQILKDHGPMTKLELFRKLKN